MLRSLAKLGAMRSYSGTNYRFSRAITSCSITPVSQATAVRALFGTQHLQWQCRWYSRPSINARESPKTKATKVAKVTKITKATKAKPLPELKTTITKAAINPTESVPSKKRSKKKDTENNISSPEAVQPKKARAKAQAKARNKAVAKPKQSTRFRLKIELPTNLVPENILVLGLDVNTNTTGWTVLNYRGSILGAGVIDTSEQKNTLDKVALLENQIRTIRDKFPLKNARWVVGIEGYLKVFGTPRFKTRTLFALCELNAIVKYTCKNILGTMPISIHPTFARRPYGLTATRKTSAGTSNIKELVLEFVKKRLDNRNEHYEWLTTSRGTFSKENYDIADSFLVSLAALRQHMKELILRDPAANAAFAKAFAFAVSQRSKRALSKKGHGVSTPEAPEEAVVAESVAPAIRERFELYLERHLPPV